MRRKNETALLENERRLLLALHRLGGRAWSRPLLDELDALRSEGMRTGPGTLLRAMSTFEKRGWVRTEEAWEPHARRYYVLVESGAELARAIADLERRRADLEQAASIVDRLTGVVPANP